MIDETVETMGEKREYSVIGKGVARVDTKAKVRGKAKYVDDINLPGMLYAATLKSPHAHARILNINTQKALSLPGVKAVITGKDLPGKKFCIVSGHFSESEEEDKLPLEKNKVRFVGDEVAAVAAVDLETAELAVELIDVQYEVLPSVLDPEEAIKLGAPRIHDNKEDNVSVSIDYDFGDVDQGFKDADFIFEDRFKTSQQAHCCMETHACVVQWNEKGRLTVWSSTQIASGFQRELAKVLGIPFGDVRIIRTAVGGSFGSKMMMHTIEPIAAYLAKKANRPVKLVYSREEEFVCSRSRHPIILEVKTGVTKDGTITARSHNVILENGAYNAQGPLVLQEIGLLLCSYYNPKNVDIKGALVYTNKPWGGSFRGYGNPQVNFAIESQMDIIARRLNIDPVEFRLKNAIKQGDRTACGWEISSCGLSECIKQASFAIGWEEKKGKNNNRGVGITSCIHWGGGVSSGASSLCTTMVEVGSGGQVSIYTGACEIGQGSDTVIAQVASEELGMSLDKVTVLQVDTDITPTFFYVGNPVTFVAGNSVKIAVADAKQQILKAAAQMKGVGVKGLDIADGGIYDKKSGEQIASVAEVAFFSWEVKGIPIVGKGHFDIGITGVDVRTGIGQFSPTYCFSAQAVEVEVDPETGVVKILKFVSAHDSGKIINRIMAEGQIEGGLSQGMGYGLSEGLVFDQDGNTLNPSLTDYKIFRAQDMPKINHILINTKDDKGPLGAKSLGESVMVPTAAAIANAVEDATGVRIKELPITPERILGK
jgi:CO/xanthine dehydrogenase Mo-binding subunit